MARMKDLLMDLELMDMEMMEDELPSEDEMEQMFQDAVERGLVEVVPTTSTNNEMGETSH